MRGAHFGFSCDCNDCREQILSLCEWTFASQTQIISTFKWVNASSWDLFLLATQAHKGVPNHLNQDSSKAKELQHLVWRIQKKTKTWSLDHPFCWILSSLHHLVFKKPKIEYLVQTRSGQNCSFYQALQQIPKRWLLVAGSLLPHSHHPERHQNENLAGKETAKWKKPPATFAYRVDDSYDSYDSGILFRVHQLLSPFHFVWFRRFVRFTTIKIAPMIHGLKKIQTTKWLQVQSWNWGTNTVWIWGNWLAASTSWPGHLEKHERAKNTGSTVIHRMNQRKGSFHSKSVIKSHASVPAMCHQGWILDDAVFNEKQHPLRAETLKICPDEALTASLAAGHIHLSSLLASNEGLERIEYRVL